MTLIELIITALFLAGLLAVISGILLAVYKITRWFCRTLTQKEVYRQSPYDNVELNHTQKSR